MSDSVRIREVSSIVAQRMVNRQELRNQIFDVLTPQQHEKDLKMIHGAMIKSH